MFQKEHTVARRQTVPFSHPAPPRPPFLTLKNLQKCRPPPPAPQKGWEGQRGVDQLGHPPQPALLPRSSRLRCGGSVWPTGSLVEQLLDAGVSQGQGPCLAEKLARRERGRGSEAPALPLCLSAGALDRGPGPVVLPGRLLRLSDHPIRLRRCRQKCRMALRTGCVITVVHSAVPMSARGQKFRYE